MDQESAALGWERADMDQESAAIGWEKDGPGEGCYRPGEG